jgi:hypothetical protein
MATRFGKSRVAFGVVWAGFSVAFSSSVEKMAIPVQNRLTSNIIPPTMPVSTCTYVLVDKFEQTEEGARSFLLLWLV